MGALDESRRAHSESQASEEEPGVGEDVLDGARATEGNPFSARALAYAAAGDCSHAAKQTRTSDSTDTRGAIGAMDSLKDPHRTGKFQGDSGDKYTLDTVDEVDCAAKAVPTCAWFHRQAERGVGAAFRAELKGHFGSNQLLIRLTPILLLILREVLHYLPRFYLSVNHFSLMGSTFILTRLPFQCFQAHSGLEISS